MQGSVQQQAAGDSFQSLRLTGGFTSTVSSLDLTTPLCTNMPLIVIHESILTMQSSYLEWATAQQPLVSPGVLCSNTEVYIYQRLS